MIINFFKNILFKENKQRFEDSLENNIDFLEYVKQDNEKRNNELADNCEHHMTRLIDVEDHYLASGYLDRNNFLKDAFSYHMELKEKSICHKFNGKKYCYHKGEEIIT